MIHCHHRRRFTRPGSRRRRATATVEFAIVLPVLIILTVGTMDVCSALFLKESAVLAAYEGARRGVGRGNTNQQVIDRVEDFLNERNIQFEQDCVSISSPGFDTAETLENVTVTVTLPTAGNIVVPTQMFADIMISTSVTMLKEYKNLGDGS